MKYSLEDVERIVQDHAARQVEEFIERAHAHGVSADEIAGALEIYGELVRETRREIREFARGDEPGTAEETH